MVRERQLMHVVDHALDLHAIAPGAVLPCLLHLPAAIDGRDGHVGLFAAAAGCRRRWCRRRHRAPGSPASARSSGRTARPIIPIAPSSRRYSQTGNISVHPRKPGNQLNPGARKQRPPMRFPLIETRRGHQHSVLHTSPPAQQSCAATFVMIRVWHAIQAACRDAGTPCNAAMRAASSSTRGQAVNSTQLRGSVGPPVSRMISRIICRSSQP